MKVYFKAENPPPGHYEQERPKTQAYQAHSNVFTSTVERRLATAIASNQNPGVGNYELPGGLSDELYDHYDMISSSFKPPCERKKIRVNLYNPHGDPQVHRDPGPAEYFKSSKTVKELKKMDKKAGGKVLTDDVSTAAA